ncbi:MAG: hypothetical protein KKE05_01930 [Nanoarchaeota archaeon]|nr:hypothetical protein [Nanoarchaeota archaeon]
MLISKSTTKNQGFASCLHDFLSGAKKIVTPWAGGRGAGRWGNSAINLARTRISKTKNSRNPKSQLTNTAASRSGRIGWYDNSRAERARPIKLAKQVQFLNKKAMSETVITSILIVLAIAAAGFTYYSLNKLFTTDLQASPAFNCLEADITSPISLKKVCLNTGGEIEALVQRSTDKFNIDELNFAIDDKTWHCSSKTCGTDCEVLPPGTSRVYYITPDENPSGKSLQFYVGTCLISEVKITNC